MRHQTLWPRGQWGQQKPHKSHYNSNFVLTICIFFLKAILPDPDRRVSITEVLPSVLPCIFLMWLKRLNFLLAVSPQCVHWKGFNFSCTVRMCALWFRRCVNVLSQKSHLNCFSLCCTRGLLLGPWLCPLCCCCCCCCCCTRGGWCSIRWGWTWVGKLVILLKKPSILQNIASSFVVYNCFVGLQHQNWLLKCYQVKIREL